MYVVYLRGDCVRVGQAYADGVSRARSVNETAWSALVGMRKREARDAAKAELAAE